LRTAGSIAGEGADIARVLDRRRVESGKEHLAESFCLEVDDFIGSERATLRWAMPATVDAGRFVALASEETIDSDRALDVHRGDFLDASFHPRCPSASGSLRDHRRFRTRRAASGGGDHRALRHSVRYDRLLMKTHGGR